MGKNCDQQYAEKFFRTGVFDNNPLDKKGMAVQMTAQATEIIVLYESLATL